jgi:hypothetical protein
MDQMRPISSESSRANAEHPLFVIWTCLTMHHS